ncbi:glutathione S-transferase T3-like [Brassica napus]|uniref:glutathione S-transferase T3-like n=1 Tax=Brassica napus TaxID=3708 RepID=UPI0006AB3731|nr:glutathione S-transferase T3-like [Brassica napus]
MDFNPFTESSNFVELLSSQQNAVFGNVSDSVSLSSSQVPFLGSQDTDDSNFGEDTQANRKERSTWTPTNDVVLISSWLNTSKDPVVGNEQRSLAFWKNIVAYFSASPKLAGCEKREASHSHEIFFYNHKKKFTLEHDWKELRNDQKWYELSTAKNDGSSKKKKCEDGSHSTSSKAVEEDYALDDEGTNRPPGVKVAKARSKKTVVDGKELSEFQTMWSIKKQDSALKERLYKMKLFDSFIAKQEPLADYEEALKKKLIDELMSK